MFIGHFAVAFALHSYFPQVPVLVFLLGVSWPDLLWGLLVPLGVERARLPRRARMSLVDFEYYPYSHSLLLGSVIAGVPAAIFGVLFSWFAGLLFVVASASHWLLDTVVHGRDLPVVGFGPDVKLGLGLWRYPRAWWAAEYLLYAAAAVVFLPGLWWQLLLVGFAFHLLTVRGVFREAENTGTVVGFAYLALVGFLGLSAALWFVIA